MPTIPLYLTAGLAFGKGGIVPLVTAEEFVQVGAEIGLILLLFMLGLEYTARSSPRRCAARRGSAGSTSSSISLRASLRAGARLGAVFGVVLGGVTYVSSSGIVAKVLGPRMDREPGDPGRAVGARHRGPRDGALPAGRRRVAVRSGGDRWSLPGLGAVVVVAVLAAATKIEVGVSRLVFSRSDESLLLTILGMTILVAGAAEVFGFSAAVRCLRRHRAVRSGGGGGTRPAVADARSVRGDVLRFVGLSVDPSIPPVLVPGAALALVTVLSKFATGWIGAARLGVGLGDG